ncbi:MAG: SMI1/KNR4 family protein [Parvibaculaceae bacterium]
MTNDEPTYRKLRRLLERWNDRGVRNLPGGTILIAHSPEIAPEAYLHSLYPPLDEERIDLIEQEIQKPLPTSLRRFYGRHNGVFLFQDTSIYGLRTSYQRSNFDAMLEQPFDIVALNTYSRPGWGNPETIFLGSRNDVTEYVGCNPYGEIEVYSKATGQCLREGYAGVLEYLVQEIERRQNRIH